MTDIIQDAKKLLESATPGPWRVYAWERHPDSDVYIMNEDKVMVTDDGWISPADGNLIAAAPELATALAQETYEYAVQIKLGAKWLFIGRGAGGHEFAKNAYWFENEKKAQAYEETRGEEHPTRYVRRRVSPVEVIE